MAGCCVLKGTGVYRNVLNLCIRDEVADPPGLPQNGSRQRLINSIDQVRGFIHEPSALLIDNHTVREEHDRRFRSARAWVNRFSVKISVLTGGSGSDIQGHANAFALVVETSSGDRPQQIRVRSHITHKHFLVAFKSTASQDGCLAFEINEFAIRRNCADALNYS